MQIGQGESLVQFFVSGLAKSPMSDRISVNGGQDGLSQMPYLLNWPKRDFEIVVRGGRKKNTLVESY